MNDGMLFLSLVLAVAILTTYIMIVRAPRQRNCNNELRGLISAGRSISVSQAIEEYEGGLGLLVRNESSLPGSWWFLRNGDNPNNCDLLTAMGQFGYVVLCNDAKERRAIDAYIGKVEVMLDPFDQ